ncbi:MAG: MMPL family transporter [Solirubrobacteraceae bacterium]
MTKATFHVTAGPAAGATIPVKSWPLLIGRESAGDAADRLAVDPELSPRHAQISQRDDRLMIEDMGSETGTYVNNSRIEAPTELRPGDTINVGSTKLVVADSAETALSTAPATAVHRVEETVVGGVPDATVVRGVPDATAIRNVADVTAVRNVAEMTAIRQTPDRSAGHEVPDATVIRPAGPHSGTPPNGTKGPRRKSRFLAMFAGIAEHHPGRWLVGIIIFMTFAGVVGAPVAGMMHAHDPFDPSASQSVRVEKLIASGSGELPGVQVIALITPPGGFDAPGTRALVESVAAKMQRDPAVKSTSTFYDTHSGSFVSRDGRLTYVAVYLKNISDAQQDDAASRLESAVANTPDVILGGPAIASHQIGSQTTADLGKAEALAFPILFLLSLWVFRGFVAALMPPFIGSIAILTTFLALRIVNSFHSLSVFALNVVIGLGLGLAIDYSLFVVSRYREELSKLGSDGSGPPGLAALGTTLQTAGRTILYSACCVALAIATLCLIPMPFMFSMGLGAAITALVAVTSSLVALPAVLGVLGPRINAGAPASWQRARDRAAANVQEGFWYRLSQAVMRRPAIIATASAVFLLVLGLPAIGIKFIGVDARDLPTSLTARRVQDAFDTRFATNASADITAIVKAPPTDAAQIAALAAKVRSLPGAAPQGAPPQALANGYFTFEVLPRDGPLSSSTIGLVNRIRALPSPQVQVSGPTAQYIDQKASITARLPLVALMLCLVTLVVLFLMTGSVVIPVKSLVMNVLSLSAAFGVLVLIFQDGHLQGLLGFKSLGAIDLSQPILIFAIAFGLAMDYGVFLLTRIKEARDGGAPNNEAVAIGLQRTGRIVTQAALLFCVAIGAFAISSVVFIKEVGIGIAVAVIIDATIIRALLVPSLMALLGERNWWAPGPLRRLHERIGLSEG